MDKGYSDKVRRPASKPFVSYPFSMNPHSSERSGLTWDGEIIPYSSLFPTLTGATANFADLYSKGNAKCKYLSAILGRFVQNLNSFGCPDRSEFRMAKGCSMPYHKFPDKSCALRNAINLYGWLKHHIQDKYVKCPKDDTGHTTVFNSGLETE
jgi:hypothetical protein